MGEKVLEGIRVVDFGWVATIPLTGMYLASFGAEVIKVESSVRLDNHRMGVGKDGIKGLNRCGHFNQLNAGKVGLTLNLSHPKGKEILMKLIAKSDIVMDNFSAGTMEKMGLGYEVLKKIKPDIIMLSSCMQGHTGPYANSPGNGVMLSALAGLDYITGWPDRKPPYLSFYTDATGPHFHRLILVAALDYRRRTGKGMYIDMSQCECALQLMAPLFLDYAVNGRIAERMGNRSDSAAPHNAYRCLGEDRWCAIAVSTDEEWQSFCEVIGNPSWTKTARFSTLLARKKNEDELDKLVEKWTIDYTPEEVMNLMQAAGVAAGVVENAQDLVEHDHQFKYQNFFPPVEHPEIELRGISPAVTLSKTPYEVKRGPLWGEANEYVVKDLLGIPDKEYQALVTEGVLK